MPVFPYPIAWFPVNALEIYVDQIKSHVQSRFGNNDVKMNVKYYCYCINGLLN